MKAAQIQAWGSIDNIKIESVNVPTPNENEVLIEVVAAGVNPIDWKVIEGYFSSFMENCFPFSLGLVTDLLSALYIISSDKDNGPFADISFPYHRN